MLFEDFADPESAHSAPRSCKQRSKTASFTSRDNSDQAATINRNSGSSTEPEPTRSASSILSDSQVWSVALFEESVQPSVQPNFTSSCKSRSSLALQVSVGRLLIRRSGVRIPLGVMTYDDSWIFCTYVQPQ